MSEAPGTSDTPDPLDSFDEIIEAETTRDPDLAVIEAGSRTLRTQGGPPQADVPARPEDPEVDKALREVEAELATRWGETKLEPSVSRIAALMDVLGEPQRSYPSIHITGTNGKTSTARMIEALLGAFELRTGRYTSPHVQSITRADHAWTAPRSTAEREVKIFVPAAHHARAAERVRATPARTGTVLSFEGTCAPARPSPRAARHAIW
ncbi:hypothetical protein SCANM63S_05360 [Streptomyces canarius]